MIMPIVELLVLNEASYADAPPATLFTRLAAMFKLHVVAAVWMFSSVRRD
jgi:hypothetical protein